jgi:iron(III) transport system substrate-binding protein
MAAEDTTQGRLEMTIFCPTAIRRSLAAAIALCAGLAGDAARAGEITVYAAVEADNLKFFGEAFARANPGIKVNWVRDSTGIIHARLVAEKDNPRADAIFGMSVTNTIALEEMGLLQPYEPKGLERIGSFYRSKTNPPNWTGLYGWGSVACINTIEARKANLPKIASWTDLGDPAFKGKVTMPNPASSGTGYLMVSGWIQMMGEEKAWAFMDRLHQNIAAYSHSGSKPCEQSAAGEYAVGLSLPLRGARLKEQGAPLDLVIPSEGTGWEMQVAGIMKGTKNLADARSFMDWAVSQGAMETYGRYSEVTAFEVKVTKSEHLPPDLAQRMIQNDFDWAAKNQQRVIAEWRKRYDAKSEPRK